MKMTMKSRRSLAGKVRRFRLFLENRTRRTDVLTRRVSSLTIATVVTALALFFIGSQWGENTPVVSAQQTACPTINGVFGQGSPDWPSTSGLQASSIDTTTTTSCVTPSINCTPGFSQPFAYDAYRFRNTGDGPACVTVSYDIDTCFIGNSSAVITAQAYLSFDPTNVCTNRIGSGPYSSSPSSFSFNVPAGATFVVVVSTGLVDAAGCRYTLQVSGLPTCEPCRITCPPNVSAVAAPTCPPTNTAVVNFPLPALSGNCPLPVNPIVCTPPSGSSFPVGTTTVTCTATDDFGLSLSCSFTVTVFNACIQDDSNPGNVILFNTFTGEYRACCSGVVIAAGVGTVYRQGCDVTLQHNAATWRVTAKWSSMYLRGSGALQLPVGSIRCTITDRDIRNNSCMCAPPVPQ